MLYIFEVKHHTNNWWTVRKAALQRNTTPDDARQIAQDLADQYNVPVRVRTGDIHKVNKETEFTVSPNRPESAA